MNSTQQTYVLQGMSCQHCVQNVQTRLSQVSGVEQVTVQLLPPRAQIAGVNITLEQLAQALQGSQFSISHLP